VTKLPPRWDETKEKGVREEKGHEEMEVHPDDTGKDVVPKDV